MNSLYSCSENITRYSYNLFINSWHCKWCQCVCSYLHTYLQDGFCYRYIYCNIQNDSICEFVSTSMMGNDYLHVVRFCDNEETLQWYNNIRLCSKTTGTEKSPVDFSGSIGSIVVCACCDWIQLWSVTNTTIKSNNCNRHWDIRSNLSYETTQRTKNCGLLTKVTFSDKCSIGGLKGRSRDTGGLKES